MMLALSSSPSWVMPGAKFDLDFINNRYYGGYVDVKANSTDFGSLGSDNGAYGTLAYNFPYTPTKSGVLYLGQWTQNRITNLGLFAERNSYNRLAYSRDLTNAAWTASNMTVSKNQIGNDNASIAAGANNTCSITATANNATISQSVTLSGVAEVGSLYVKRLTGTGTFKLAIDGGTTYTDLTSQITTTGYSWVQIPVQTVTNPSYIIQVGTSGDSFAIDFCQMEDCGAVGNKATTPLISDANGLGRRANAPIFSGSSGPINNGQSILRNVFSTGGPWTMMMSFNGDDAIVGSGGPALLASDMASPVTIIGGGGVALGIGASNQTPNIGNNGRGNWNIGATRCNGAGTVYCLNGGGLSGINAGNLPNVNNAATHFNIGNNGSGSTDFPLNGSIGRVAFWAQEISDGQMIEWTNLMTGRFRTF